MSKANTSDRVPAVGYLRRSTDKQEASIPEQREAIQKYADEKDYKVIRWYTDDAISGDDTEKRYDFLRMVSDASNLGDFKVIICWDQKRFGRFDSVEAGHYLYPIRKAGVRIALLDRGLIDLYDPNARIIFTVNQEGANKDLRDHGANVARGMLGAMKNGGWVGSPPYGYRLEGKKKNKRLVIDDDNKVQVVKRIFHEFVEERRSMRDIAARLNDEGFTTPSDRVKGWRWDTVRCILENPAYAGDFAAGRGSYGKYHRIANGELRKSEGASRTANPKSQWIIHRDHHDWIIDRETFEKAQAIFAERKTGRSPYKPQTNPYVLHGLLRCGKCGCPMWGIMSKGRRYYECGHRQYTKASGKADCEGTTVREDELLESLGNYLVNWLGFGDCEIDAAQRGELQPSDLPEAFEQVKKLVTPPSMPKKDRERLKKRAEKLKADIAKARGNLAFIKDRENIPAVEDKIRQMDDERAAIEEELKQTDPPSEKDINAVALETLRNLYSLAACCWDLANGDSEAEPMRIRRFLNHASHIIIHSVKRGNGKGTRHTFECGEIVFKGVGVSTSKVNPRPHGPKPCALPS